MPDINSDVQDLANKICDKLDDFRDAVPNLNGEELIRIADEVDKLNEQLQGLLLPKSETSKAKAS
jgi:protein subunit release factor A